MAEEKKQEDVHYEYIETAEGRRWRPTAILFCWESSHAQIRGFDMDHISDYNPDYIIADDATEILGYGVTSEDGEENFKEWSRRQPPRPTVEGSNWAEPPSEVGSDEEKTNADGDERVRTYVRTSVQTSGFQPTSDRLPAKTMRTAGAAIDVPKQMDRHTCIRRSDKSRPQ